MEVTTIFGIIIAVIVIVIGLRLLLKKTAPAEPSLESSLYIDPQSQQPIIPRHVRDQLAVETDASGKKEPQLDSQTVEIKDETIVTDTQTIKEEQIEITDQAQNQTKQHATDNTENTDKTNHTDNLEQAVVLQEVDRVENSQLSAETTKDKTLNKDTEFTLNNPTNTVEVNDYDGDSDLLDLHLHQQQSADEESALAMAEEIIALYVYPNHRVLSGDKALKTLRKFGLRYGEMSCFHRYEDTEKVSPLMFSVLRSTNEGPVGFDLESLAGEQIDGLAFFLALPHNHALTGYDMMVSTAGLVAREIGGTIYDENNQEFNNQTKEKLRHFVMEYQPNE